MSLKLTLWTIFTSAGSIILLCFGLLLRSSAGLYVKGAKLGDQNPEFAPSSTGTAALGAFGCYFFLTLCLLSVRLYRNLTAPDADAIEKEKRGQEEARRAMGYVDLHHGGGEQEDKTGGTNKIALAPRLHGVPKLPDFRAGSAVSSARNTSSGGGGGGEVELKTFGVVKKYSVL